MTGPPDQRGPSQHGENPPDGAPVSARHLEPSTGANETAPTGNQPEPLPPVGSDAPNRWLISDPPGDIDALRSSSSRPHRPIPRRGRFRIMPLLLAVVILAGVAAWQLGWIDSVLSSTPDVQAALNGAGYASVTATVDGETAVLSGTVQSEDDLSLLAAIAFSVDGISRIDNQVTVLAETETLESKIQAALAEAGFADLAVVVQGDTAVVSGVVADEESISAAALAALNVPGVAQLDNRLEIGTVGLLNLQARLTAALTADEFAYVTYTVENGLAVLQGAVPSEEARSSAASVALGVQGIDKIDNRLTVDTGLPIGPALPAEKLEAAATTALAGAGIETVGATVQGRRAVLDGTVPLETLGSGFFAFVDLAESTVLSVEGIDQVSSRLTLRGDGAILRSELETLLATTPVEFALGSTDLPSGSQPVLDQAALVIQSQPGLQVIIAGHTDAAGTNETNQALGRQRAEAVRNYLLTRGVPSYRLVAVSYGELFPDQEATAEQNRRVDFEVGP